MLALALQSKIFKLQMSYIKSDDLHICETLIGILNANGIISIIRCIYYVNLCAVILLIGASLSEPHTSESLVRSSRIQKTTRKANKFHIWLVHCSCYKR